jgi:hypothetical protein
MMAKPAWACFLSAIVLTFICAGIYAFIERADVAKATLSEVAAIVGVDTNTTGNTATTVGTIDRCVSVSLTPPNNTFYIDLFVKGVTDLNSWDGTLSFNETKIQVNSLVVDGYFLGSAGYPVMNCYPGPGDEGVCQVSNVDTNYAGHSGQGVLGRLQLTALAAGTSKLYFTLWEPPFGVSGVTLRDHADAIIGDLDSDTFFDGLVFNAMVVVGGPCPIDADLDGFTNVEESVDGSDLLNAASTPEMCDGVDNDLDGLTDEWYDRDPANGTPDCTDADSDSDGVHPHNPTDTDDDNDTWVDAGTPVAGKASEAYMATDSLADCRVNQYHSAWPLDINNDGSITVVGDVLNVSGLIGSKYGDIDGQFRKRLDFDGNGSITVVGDVLKFSGHIGQACS